MIAACALLAALAAQAPPQRPTFGASVEAVYLDVVVIHDGRAVPGLEAADFDVRDQGVRQTVRVVQREDLPLTAVLVFDASTSVFGERLDHLRAAGRALIAGLREKDEAALVTFSHELAIVAPQARGASAVARALEAIRPSGATAVWDALYAGLKLPRARGRALVVLFTDAEDNMSWLAPDQVKRVAEESNAVVHVVAPQWQYGEPRDLRPLRRLAEATGGRLWTAGAAKDLEPTFLRILSEMQSAYLLTYEPTGVGGEGWHPLQVKVRRGRGSVRTRHGYFVPPRPSR